MVSIMPKVVRPAIFAPSILMIKALVSEWFALSFVLDLDA